MKFTTNTYRDKTGKYTGQVLLGDRVIFEDEGNAFEHQARANVEDGFALWLRWAIELTAEYHAGTDEDSVPTLLERAVLSQQVLSDVAELCAEVGELLAAMKPAQ